MQIPGHQQYRIRYGVDCVTGTQNNGTQLYTGARYKNMVGTDMCRPPKVNFIVEDALVGIDTGSSTITKLTQTLAASRSRNYWIYADEMADKVGCTIYIVKCRVGLRFTDLVGSLYINAIRLRFSVVSSLIRCMTLATAKLFIDG